jgi:hypothetical protein
MSKQRLKILVDIDNTICRTIGTDYENSVPIQENIARINRLYYDGHYIHYFTARGSGTGIDWSELTKRQLKEWGAIHDQLSFGKPVADVIIDDIAFNVERIDDAIRHIDRQTG